MAENWLYDYDSFTEPPDELLGGSSAINSSSNGSAAPIAAPSGTLVAGYAFDLLQPDSGSALQDELPKELNTTSFTGKHAGSAGLRFPLLQEDMQLNLEDSSVWIWLLCAYA
jgi:hypothetical protein